jgi:hypothetical protein
MFIPNRYTLFLSKVNTHNFDPLVCWEWLGAGKGNGYGNATFESRQRTAQAVSHELFIGPIPDGYDVCHTCDTRCCVNPDHLFAGTRQQNVDDCVAKGRASGGPRKHLKENAIQEVRRRFHAGHSPRKISIQMGITYSVIIGITSGRNYVERCQ